MKYKAITHAKAISSQLAEFLAEHSTAVRTPNETRDPPPVKTNSLCPRKPTAEVDQRDPLVLNDGLMTAESLFARLQFR